MASSPGPSSEGAASTGVCQLDDTMLSEAMLSEVMLSDPGLSETVLSESAGVSPLALYANRLPGMVASSWQQPLPLGTVAPGSSAQGVLSSHAPFALHSCTTPLAVARGAAAVQGVAMPPPSTASTALTALADVPSGTWERVPLGPTSPSRAFDGLALDGPMPLPQRSTVNPGDRNGEGSRGGSGSAGMGGDGGLAEEALAGIPAYVSDVSMSDLDRMLKGEREETLEPETERDLWSSALFPSWFRR